MGIGNNIRKAREAKGLTTRQLGELVGVDASTVCRWENDKKTPLLRHLFRLATELEVDVADLTATRTAPESIIAQ